MFSFSLWPVLPAAEGAVARIAAFVTAVTVIFLALRKLYRMWMTTVEDRRRTLEAVAEVHAQLLPNGGKSLRDAVDHHSDQIAALSETTAALGEVVARMAAHLERPKRRRWDRSC